MTKKELILRTKSSTLTEACLKLGITRQNIYLLLKKNQEYNLNNKLKPNNLNASIEVYNRIIEKIESESNRQNIKSLTLINISDKNKSVTIKVKLKNKETFVYNSKISDFMSRGISVKKLKEKNED